MRNPPRPRERTDDYLRRLERQARQYQDLGAALEYTIALERIRDVRQALALDALVRPVVAQLLLTDRDARGVVGGSEVPAGVVDGVVDFLADLLVMLQLQVVTGRRPWNLRNFGRLGSTTRLRTHPEPGVFGVGVCAGTGPVVAWGLFYSPLHPGFGVSFESLEPWLAEPAASEPAIGVQQLAPGASSEVPSLIYRFRALGPVVAAWSRFAYARARGRGPYYRV